MCAEKTITLSLDKARKMYGKNPEMDELLLANFSKDELTKKELPKTWKEINRVAGYFIASDGTICETRSDTYSDPILNDNKRNFATEKQAKSALAMAQLSQLIAVYNDGWEPDWGNANMEKRCISRSRNFILATTYRDSYQFLAFKNCELRDEFLKNFEPLIKEYFMID